MGKTKGRKHGKRNQKRTMRSKSFRKRRSNLKGSRVRRRNRSGGMGIVGFDLPYGGPTEKPKMKTVFDNVEQLPSGYYLNVSFDSDKIILPQDFVKLIVRNKNGEEQPYYKLKNKNERLNTGLSDTAVNSIEYHNKGYLDPYKI